MNINTNNFANQKHEFEQASDGANKVDLNSRGGRVATNYLEQNGPITKQQVNNLRNIYTNDIKNHLDQNQYEPSVFDEKIEILNLLSQLANTETINFAGALYLISEFDFIEVQDVDHGLSSTDLRSAFG